jgi:hypothetical protein
VSNKDDLNSQHKQDSESPFLDEFFSRASISERESSVLTLEEESPFLHVLYGNPRSVAETEELKDEYLVDEFDSEFEEEFPEGYDENLDEDRITFEYDSPAVGSSSIQDSLLAILPFSYEKRTTVGALLTPAQSKAAVRRNSQMHPRNSGVDPASIVTALQNYVDFSAINRAIVSYNSQNPSAPIDLGMKPIDAVFVEAIHQFQMKCYKDPKQRDGLAGPSALDSLGFWPRKGLLSSAQTNAWARKRVQSKEKKIEEALTIMPTELVRDLKASNWWISFVNPCFLGWGFVYPIHVYFARKLRKAEQWLLSQPRFAGKTPVELSVLLDINEKHAGGRGNPGSKSIHTFGLAIDIKYSGNPHIGDYRDKPKGAKRFSEVMKRAAAKISGLNIVEKKFPEYLHKVGSDETKTTGQIYDELFQRDQDLRKYLALTEAASDLSALKIGVFKGSVERDPRKGFFNLDRDLVNALRDHACLVWGAVDFGPNANGDIMHFDCRLDDLGRAIYCGTGGTFNEKHPCWRRSDKPCPEAKRKTSTTKSPPSGELLYSDYENEYLTAPTDLPEQFIEPVAEEFEQSQEQGDFNDILYEPGESEQLFETEVPPLLNRPAKSDPPGQTVYVQIDLGKDSRCVKRDERKQCVLYQTFRIRSMTGIFIPENYSPQQEVDLILYLHGFKTALPGSDALIAEYWDADKYSVFAMREEINASQRNIILVAPTLGLKSEAGDLTRGHGLDNYLDKVLEALKSYSPYKGQSPTIGNLILAAHSGGGAYMRKLALSGSRYADKIKECWGFDSLYNSSDVKYWLQWAQRNSGASFYSYYYDKLPTRNSRNLEGRAPNIYPIESTIKNHYKLVRVCLRERLEAAQFLNIAKGGVYELAESFSTEEGIELYRDEELQLAEYEIEDLEAESHLEQEKPKEPKLLDVTIMHDDFQNPLSEGEIIGLDGGRNLNIQLTTSTGDSVDRGSIRVKLVIRTPGKPREEIVTRALSIPKIGVDPHNASNVLFQLSVPLTDIGKILSPLDGVNEIATVRRIGGTSDSHLLRALGANWKLRGQAEQADKCGVSSGSFSDERPEALKLFQTGGIAILELKDTSNAVRIKRFVRNPADIFYYTGHGTGLGFSRRVGAAPPMNCLAIEDHASVYGYCCWASPSNLIPHWKSPMDLDVLIIAGCSVLAVDGSKEPPSGDGLEWAKLVQVKGGPLKALLGYGDWDDNEHGGPMGATAPSDKAAGNAIASEIGKWIKTNPKLDGIIRKWLTINMSHQNIFGVGIDKNGVYWRTRRKNTLGWKLEAKLITRIEYIM